MRVSNSVNIYKPITITFETEQEFVEFAAVLRHAFIANALPNLGEQWSMIDTIADAYPSAYNEAYHRLDKHLEESYKSLLGLTTQSAAK